MVPTKDRPVFVGTINHQPSTINQERSDMEKLTSEGQKVIRELAQRFQVSADAVLTVLEALVRGNGTLAQFTHPELGGAGQWMKGGMTQIGDLFNHALKARVDGLCSALSAYLGNEPGPLSASQEPSSSRAATGSQGGLFARAFGRPAAWWPQELGHPGATGASNGVRYAYFAGSKRLVVEVNGTMTVYDSLDHQITGISVQQVNGNTTLRFTSQTGAVDLVSLPVLSRGAPSQTGPKSRPGSGAGSSAGAGRGSQGRDATASAGAGEDAMATIERLYQLKQMGALTEEEFAAKKAELLRSV
jgi:hypothetical protein